MSFMAYDPSEIKLIIGSESISLREIALVLEAEIECLDHLNDTPVQAEIYRSIRGHFLAKDDNQWHFIERNIFEKGKTFQLIGNPKGQNAKKAKPFDLKSCVIVNMPPHGGWFIFSVNNQSKLL